MSYEYVACQRDNAGVLILSEFAGAAQSLGELFLQLELKVVWAARVDQDRARACRGMCDDEYRNESQQLQAVGL